MKALIDADVLLHECSAVAEAKPTSESGEDRTLKSFDFVKELFDGRVSDILQATQADDYILYITGDGNFRYEVAVTKPYKGNRVQEKPYHYDNLKAYVMSLPETILVEGMEADDAMAIDQTEDTVICTRDKDLRMVPGWHYGWECGYQPEFKMQKVDEIGSIYLAKNKKEVKGTGLKFFWAQMIVGDKVDNIPGIEGDGPVAAMEVLDGANTPEGMFNAVRARYELTYGEEWEERMIEQGRLLWMCREVNEDGSPVMWEIPVYDGEEVQ